jgi:serine/threonine protein kinase
MSSEGREETSKEYVSTVHDSRGSWKEDIDTPSSASESGEEEEGDLKVKLLTSMEESQFEKTQGRYLPRNKFDEIFCPQPERKDGRIPAIFEPMGLSLVTPTDEDLSLVDHVLEHCRILFLIAVYIELNPEPLRTLMSIFRRDKFTDKRLPIDIWPMRKLKAGIKKHPFHPFVEMEQRHEPTRTLRIWDLKSIEKFQSEQWNFLIPIISTTEIFHDFRHCRIPFVARHEVVGKGGNGIVYQYTIHEAHFNDPPPLLPINTDEIVSPISMNNLPLPTHLENPPLPINMDNPPPPFKTNNIPALINMIEASPAISAQRAKTAIVAVKELRKGNEVAKRWEKEVKALARMNGFNHKHIVRFITSFQRRNTSDDIDYYVVFEWADGGNLSTFRAAYPHPELTAVLIKWVIQQLYGLAQALSKAHYLDEEGSYRHGYLKPANILWFKQGDTEFGTLKIGDWGEAKEHYNGTAYRRDTTAQYGTRRYEPPEVSTGLKLNLSRDSKFARSRLYDIWGIGCITLEFIIWLMYGLDTLKNFNRLNIGDYGVSDMFYEVSLGKPAKVHAVARHWMNHMAKDPRCSRNKTALGDLLEIVRTGLLIVKLPPEGGAKRPHLQSNPSSEALNLESNRFRPSTDTAEIVGIGHGKDIAIQVTQDLEDPVLANPGEPRRCLATDFESELLRISKVKDESYWYQEYISKPTPVGARSSDFLSVNPGPIASTRNVSGLRYNGSELENYGTKDRADLHTWRFECDNTFAKGIFSRLKNLGLPPPRAIPVSENLCNQCMAVGGRLWSPFFEETYNMELLERNASKGECDLCVILWNTDPESRYPASPQVKFRRQGYMITMDGLKPPVLALFQNNGKNQFIVSTSMQQN